MADQPTTDTELAEAAQDAEADGRTRHWHLFVSGDQIRKGAALNAVQIAETLGARVLKKG